MSVAPCSDRAPADGTTCDPAEVLYLDAVETEQRLRNAVHGIAARLLSFESSAVPK